jgi:hypothetical protein
MIAKVQKCLSMTIGSNQEDVTEESLLETVAEMEILLNSQFSDHRVHFGNVIDQKKEPIDED